MPKTPTLTSSWKARSPLRKRSLPGPACTARPNQLTSRQLKAPFGRLSVNPTAWTRSRHPPRPSKKGSDRILDRARIVRNGLTKQVIVNGGGKVDHMGGSIVGLRRRNVPANSRQVGQRASLAACCPDHLAQHRHRGPPTSPWRGYRTLHSAISIGSSPHVSFHCLPSLVSPTWLHPFGGFGLKENAVDLLTNNPRWKASTVGDVAYLTNDLASLVSPSLDYTA